jgi:hypothetical protein
MSRALVFLLAGTALFAAEPPITIKFDFYANSIFFPGTINGRGPFRLLFDTAANGSPLNSSRIKDVGLPVLSEYDRPNSGGGENATHFSTLPGARVEFGGARLDLPELLAIPMDELAAIYGCALDAIIGRQLMEKYVVKIDYDTRTLTLFDPDTLQYSGPGTVLPISIIRGGAQVRAKLTLAGRTLEGNFLIDAPFPDAVMFTTPFHHAHNLTSAARKLTPRLIPGLSHGVGGRIEEVHGRLESLSIGPYTLKLPTATFPESEAGAFARTDIAGILGGEVWRRFRVWLDYAHHRLILEPAAHYDDPFEFDASGLLIRTTGPPFREFVVSTVVEDTPGSEAGVHVGDRVLAIDGRPAADFTMWDIRSMLRKADRRYSFKLRRGDTELEATLVTRRLI